MENGTHTFLVEAISHSHKYEITQKIQKIIPLDRKKWSADMLFTTNKI
jgi:hypothetical protein